MRTLRWRMGFQGFRKPRSYGFAGACSRLLIVLSFQSPHGHGSTLQDLTGGALQELWPHGKLPPAHPDFPLKLKCKLACPHDSLTWRISPIWAPSWSVTQPVPGTVGTIGKWNILLKTHEVHLEVCLVSLWRVLEGLFQKQLCPGPWTGVEPWWFWRCTWSLSQLCWREANYPHFFLG